MKTPKYEIFQEVEEVPGNGFVRERNGRHAVSSTSGRKAIETALIQWGEDSKGNHIQPRYCWNHRKQYVRDRSIWQVFLTNGHILTLAIRKAN